MAYQFDREDNTVVKRLEDNACFSWNVAQSRPTDFFGRVGRQWVQDGSPTPAAYVAPAPTPLQVREQSFLADADYQDLLTRLAAASPSQIKTYVQNNVTDLPSAKVFMTKLALLIALVARNS